MVFVLAGIAFAQTSIFTTSTGVTSTPPNPVTAGGTVKVEVLGNTWQNVHDKVYEWTGTQWTLAGTLAGPRAPTNGWFSIQPNEKAELSLSPVSADKTLAIFACNQIQVPTGSPASAVLAYDCNGNVLLDANNQFISNAAKWMIYTLTVQNLTNVTNCTDSDGGLNQFVFGVVSTNNGSNSSLQDACSLGPGSVPISVQSCQPPLCSVREFYCGSSQQPRGAWLNCTYGCANGACLNQSNVTNITNVTGQGLPVPPATLTAWAQVRLANVAWACPSLTCGATCNSPSPAGLFSCQKTFQATAGTAYDLKGFATDSAGALTSDWRVLDVKVIAHGTSTRPQGFSQEQACTANPCATMVATLPDTTTYIVETRARPALDTSAVPASTLTPVPYASSLNALVDAQGQNLNWPKPGTVLFVVDPLTFTVNVQNTGSVGWTQGRDKLTLKLKDLQGTVVYANSWDLPQASVAAGASVVFSVPVPRPNLPGQSVNLVWQMSHDNVVFGQSDTISRSIAP